MRHAALSVCIILGGCSTPKQAAYRGNPFFLAPRSFFHNQNTESIRGSLSSLQHNSRIVRLIVPDTTFLLQIPSGCIELSVTNIEKGIGWNISGYLVAIWTKGTAVNPKFFDEAYVNKGEGIRKIILENYDEFQTPYTDFPNISRYFPADLRGYPAERMSYKYSAPRRNLAFRNVEDNRASFTKRNGLTFFKLPRRKPFIQVTVYFPSGKWGRAFYVY